MKTALASVALFVAGVLAQFTINTPSNVVECQPTLISWSGGTGDVLPGNTPNGAAIESFPSTNGTSYTWTCNIASGTYIGFTLRDSTGSVAQTAPVTINPGSSTSCINITSVAGGTPTGSSSPQTTEGATTTGNAVGTTGAASSASATSTSTGTNGASANAAQLGAAGIAGVAIAAFFL